MTAALATVTLDDKYALDSGRVFLTGTQALARLLIMQHQRDRARGLNTAGFVSGYRGSPLGGLDQTLWKAKKFMAEHHIHFQPGLNEDLAATAVWGSQQVGLWPGSRYDGVFAMWYGKGPGVDRSGDVFKHGNLFGTSKLGGVLVIAGDDHAAKSSTLPHQSEYAFMDAMIPVLNPAGVQEILDLGIFGWELSRYCGCWIALKTISENVDSSASVYVDPQRVQIVIPTDFELPPEGVHGRWPTKPLEQEYIHQKYRLYAALAFAKANRLNRIVLDSPNPRFGIVTTGKSYLDVMQALNDLGIDEREAARIGLRVYKVGMSWPLERDGVREFAQGLEEVLVVEEKRAVIENQFKEQLYNWREDVRPRVIGKFDENREWILPSTGELTPARIARVIANRIARFHTSETIQRRLAFLEAKEEALSRPRELIERVPHFCSGCPHNTSTRVPEGSRAMGGIGCHYMVTWMDRRTDTFTQMGGEGVTWIGQAPFTDTPHVFQNLGDGTYFHSGILAIRAAIAANVNITYKLLYNDAVAMTGGQPIDGTLTVPQLSHQLYGEGVRRIAVMSDEPQKYQGHKSEFPPGVTFHHRDELDKVQRELREVKGVSVLIYDQVCATEKRRRRKRGLMEDPPKRAFINDLVCEGCGDCSIQSNCLSVIPLETEFGRKRAIDQSNCNKDFSCIKGFCPSFVTVHGGRLRKNKAAASAPISELPEPTLPAIDQPYDIFITGVGGTGVVTIGALLGMASHIEGKGVSVLDMTGLAQKYGAVVSHVRIAPKPEAIHAVRIAAGNARLLLGCDLVVAASNDALSKLNPETSQAVVNIHQSMPAGFTRNPDFKFPGQEMLDTVREAAGQTHAVDATTLATELLGDAIYANPFLMGYAWQKGLIPLSQESLFKAIELNGTAVETNKAAFQWGRYAAVDPEAVQRVAEPVPLAAPPARTLEEIVARRVAFLTDYQNASYAQRYRKLVDKVQAAERDKTPGQTALAEAVARYYFKLMAYKDEYEVARLYTSGEFLKKLEAQFEGDYTLEFHLAPPLFAKRDPDSGHLLKRSYGPWMLKAFSYLARLRFLRGTPLDVFGYSAERRHERQLIKDYAALIEQLVANLGHDNHAIAVELASLPEHIRGYGHVKEASLSKAEQRKQELLNLFRNPPRKVEAAA
ncbi:MAG TPA: indolepyruvate ferredoxin oxidoreductase family protein [Candidatus Competibacteraceae bacterium]|nr:indolepyruvate ferredoxin oxidoreductase family protein [Candidatus Competibacteraceae bacterium]